MKTSAVDSAFQTTEDAGWEWTLTRRDDEYVLTLTTDGKGPVYRHRLLSKLLAEAVVFVSSNPEGATTS